jgi:mRNA degradation ribonuclease J1/J2
MWEKRGKGFLSREPALTRGTLKQLMTLCESTIKRLNKKPGYSIEKNIQKEIRDAINGAFKQAGKKEPFSSPIPGREKKRR